MSKRTARQTISFAGWESGTEGEVEMVVTFTVYPGRAQTQTGPAEPASAQNISIRMFDQKGKNELTCPTWLEERFADDASFQSWLLSEAADQDEYARDCKADADREERRLAL